MVSQAVARLIYSEEAFLIPECFFKVINLHVCAYLVFWLFPVTVMSPVRLYCSSSRLFSLSAPAAKSD
jgi:hypothetical protein